MAAKYLKQQFSIPHHLVPSFEDTAGVLAQAEDSHLLHDNHDDSDDPIVPGAPVSSLRSHHAERDRSVIIDKLFLYYIQYNQLKFVQGSPISLKNHQTSQ